MPTNRPLHLKQRTDIYSRDTGVPLLSSLGTGFKSNDPSGLNCVEMSSVGDSSWNKAPNI